LAAGAFVIRHKTIKARVATIKNVLTVSAVTIFHNK